MRLYVSLATVPGREQSLPVAVRSLVEQQRPPDRLLVVVPTAFTLRASLRNGTLAPAGERDGAARGALAAHALAAHPLVETRACARDDGPGTKLLCALPRVAASAAPRGKSRCAAARCAAAPGSARLTYPG